MHGFPLASFDITTDVGVGYTMLCTMADLCDFRLDPCLKPTQAGKRLSRKVLKRLPAPAQIKTKIIGWVLPCTHSY